MAIKYYVAEEQRKVIAVLSDTRYDVVQKIDKIMRDTSFCACSEKYLMPNMFRVEVVADEEDAFNVEIGKQVAKKRLMERYYRAYDKRMGKFLVDFVKMQNKILEYCNGRVENT